MSYRLIHARNIFPATLLLALILSGCRAKDNILRFSAMADVPYSLEEEELLQQQIRDHNRFVYSDFMVHLGDIKKRDKPCTEDAYAKIAGYLKKLTVPTFVLPGDNEWNRCEDPDAAWALWEKYFLGFEKNFRGAPTVERQDVRPENFAWVTKGVLIIGLNLVGGNVHDAAEWKQRHRENAEWVQQQLQKHRSDIRGAAVLFQAHPEKVHDDFMEQFLVSATQFGKPVLMLHGDGHEMNLQHPSENIKKYQLDNGGDSPPIQVVVTFNEDNMFVINGDPVHKEIVIRDGKVYWVKR